MVKSNSCSTLEQLFLLGTLVQKRYKICINIVQVYKLYTPSNTPNYHKTLIMYLVVHWHAHCLVG